MDDVFRGGTIYKERVPMVRDRDDGLWFWRDKGTGDKVLASIGMFFTISQDVI